jgi:hypothetical protein
LDLSELDVVENEAPEENSFSERLSLEDIEQFNQAKAELNREEKDLWKAKADGYSWPEIALMLGKASANAARMAFSRLKEKIFGTLQHLQNVFVSETVEPPVVESIPEAICEVNSEPIDEVPQVRTGFNVRLFAQSFYKTVCKPIQEKIVRKPTASSTVSARALLPSGRSKPKSPLELYLKMWSRLWTRKGPQMGFVTTLALAWFAQPVLSQTTPNTASQGVGYCVGWLCGPTQKFASAEFVTTADAQSIINFPFIMAQIAAVVVLALFGVVSMISAGDGRNWINSLGGVFLGFLVLLAINFIAGWLTGTITSNGAVAGT